MGFRSRFERVFTAAALVLAASVALPAGPARAATDAEQAEALIREGVKLRGGDKTAQALPLFEQAYQISRSPRTAAQLGLCELELGHFADADRHLTEALAAPDHPWVKKNKSALKKSLETASANVGELALTVAPASADVLLNRKPVDRALLGAPIRVSKGPVDVEVSAPEHEPARETITIVAGKREQRTYTLVRAAPKPAASEIVAGSVVSPPGSGAAVTLSATGASGEAGGYKKGRIAAWATGAAALGAVVFGTVEAVSAASASNAFNSHTIVINGMAYHDCGTADLSPACEELKNDRDRALALSVVGYVAAGALAVTSAVLFVTSSHGTERDGVARTFACVPDPVGRGLGCSLRF